MKRQSGVPIDLIKNANPVFARSDFGDLHGLAKDIQSRDLQGPILLDSTYQVLSGARRVMALDMLGIREAPAISTDNWPTIRDHMIAEVERDATGEWPLKPMNWDELLRLRKILNPIYDHYRRANPPADRNRRGAGRKARVLGYSKIVQDLSSMTGIEQPKLVALLALQGQMDVIRYNFPSEIPRMKPILAEIVGQGDGQIHTAVRRLSALRTGKPEVEPNVKRAQAQLEIFRKGFQVIATAAQELSDLGELNPALTDEEIVELHRSMAMSSRRLTAARGRIKLQYEARKLQGQGEEA